MNNYEGETERTAAKVVGLIILLALLFLTIIMLITSGCVTATKNTYAGLVATPTPEPTEVVLEVTAAPEEAIPPVVTITEDPDAYMLRTNGFHMRDWHQWYRANVQGINARGTKDLRTLVTVYDYKFMDSYHIWSTSWGRKFVTKPDDREDQFLFIFVNMYSDDIFADDVRQYGMDCTHFSIQIDDRLIFTDHNIEPEQRITEFDNLYTFDHVETPGPYDYQIIQEPGSGIITAHPREWLIGGRSNAWDGYCRYQVPRRDEAGNPVNATNIKVVGNFNNLGGTAWWQLE